MVDLLFADERLAALYDKVVLHPANPRRDLDFYLPRVLAARSVLDVGCGTGMLLHRAREAGHTGRLCGLDPATGMLQQARRRTDIEWVQGDLDSTGFDREFDLVVMTGHVFQVFLTDGQLRRTLACVRAALTDGGRLAFETRNPAARAWERWNPDNALEIMDTDGAVVRMWHELRPSARPDLISFASVYVSPGWDRPRVSHSTLRFLDVDSLDALLHGAGFVVDERYGDWDARPMESDSPEVIVVARTIETPDGGNRAAVA